MSDKADVIVVGAGVIGLAGAWRLRQRGPRVWVFDQGTAGCGASRAALGVLMPAPATRRGAFQSLQRRSLADFPGLAAELHARTGCDIGYCRSGLIEVLHGEGRRQQAVGETRAACAEWTFDLPKPLMEVLNADAAGQLEPEVRFQEHGARVCHVTANVDVAGLVDALRAVRLAEGVELREQCAVQRIAVSRGQAQGVEHAAGHATAAAVLVAAGAWTGLLGVELATYAEMRPVRGQAMLLHAPHVRLSRIVKQQGIYLIPRGDGSIMLGATTEPESGFNPRPTGQGIAELTAAALALVPALANADVMQTWAGLRPEPVGGHLVLGAVPGTAGLYVAAGHYKTGVGLAGATAQAMAELITTGSSTVDLTPFAPRAHAA